MMKFDGERFSQAERVLPEERAVAISVGGSTHAVMMASPHDLEDFAYGFLQSDGVITQAADIEDLTIVAGDLGLDIQIRLEPSLAQNYRSRRRAMIGPVGCGLCGIESLELAVPELARVEAKPVGDDFPWRALEILHDTQIARKRSGALHAAALFSHQGELLFAREDIGRHNAVDKSIGAAMRKGISTQGEVLVVSSRVSLDLVVKAVRAGLGTLIARASPSDLAMHYALQWDLQVIAPVFETEYFRIKDE